jgi:hypothetical protein
MFLGTMHTVHGTGAVTGQPPGQPDRLATNLTCLQWFCSKIAEAEAAVSVNEKKCFVMHMHVQLQLDDEAAVSAMVLCTAVGSTGLMGTNHEPCLLDSPWAVHQRDS